MTVLELLIGQIEANLANREKSLTLSLYSDSRDTLFESLPEILYELDHLEHLAIYNGRIGKFLEGFAKLKNLKKIEFFCELDVLPEELKLLPKLHTLTLRTNKPLKSEFDFSMLKALKNLNLDYNELTNIPQSIYECKNLSVLNLKGNRLESLNWEKLSLTIKSMNVSQNKLKVIGDGIGNLSKLEVLYLNSNKLTALPSTFSKLSKLSSLYLENNLLETFPNEILELKRLRFFDISSNKLNDIPLEMSSLPNLKKFKYTSNPLDKSSAYKKLTLAGVYQKLKTQQSDLLLLGTIKIREEFTTAVQRYLVGFSTFLKETKGLSVSLVSKKIHEGLEVEIELPEKNSATLDIVSSSFNDYYSLINSVNIDSPEEKIAELSKENVLLRLELQNSINSLKNDLHIQQTKASLMQTRSEELYLLLGKSIDKPFSLHLNNNVHQKSSLQMLNEYNTVIDISYPRDSFENLYSFLLDKNLLTDSAKEAAKDLKDELNNLGEEIEANEVEKKPQLKNKTANFIKKAWDIMKTNRDIVKFPKDLIEGYAFLLGFAAEIGAKVDPSLVDQVKHWISTL